MLEPLLPNSEIDLKFNRENLAKLSKYFDLNFLDSSLDQKILFFNNLHLLSRRSLGLAHNIQHHATSLVSVNLCSSSRIKSQVLDHPYGQWIGCSSQGKRSDDITLTDNVLNGEKRWLSNLDIADYAVIQIQKDQQPYIVYIDLHTVPHKTDFEFFTPIGMEMSRPGNLIFDNQPIDPECVLGVKGTQSFFQQSNFSSQCFLTNHFGLTKQLFLDIKQYAEKNKCGAEFEIAKLEMDICALEMMWHNNIDSINETVLTHEFWNRRNTQYAFSKKTLIRVIQLILELGVSYYTDAHSEFSQRFRDAITYASHMHPLYRFGQEFYMLDLDHSRG
jgi:hypothetical protein